MNIFQAFETINCDQNIAVEGCHYELIWENRFQDILNFYRDHYVADEPINRSLSTSWDDDMQSLVLAFLKEKLSICLVSSTTGEIIGGRVCSIENKHNTIDTTKFKSEALRKAVDMTYYFDSLCNIFDHYKVDEVIHFAKLAVHRNFRGKGIGTKLMKAAIAFVKNLQLGPLVIKGEGSSNFSQRIYERLGFDILAELKYGDYKVNGDVVVTNAGENKSEKLYGKVI